MVHFCINRYRYFSIIHRIINSTSRWSLQKIESRDSNICTFIFIAALFTVAKRLETTEKYPLMNEWINKMQFIYTMES